MSHTPYLVAMNNQCNKFASVTWRIAFQIFQPYTYTLHIYPQCHLLGQTTTTRRNKVLLRGRSTSWGWHRQCLTQSTYHYYSRSREKLPELCAFELSTQSFMQVARVQWLTSSISNLLLVSRIYSFMCYRHTLFYQINLRG